MFPERVGEIQDRLLLLEHNNVDAAAAAAAQNGFDSEWEGLLT